MRNHFRFRDFIIKMGLDYSYDEEKGIFIVYTWVKIDGEYHLLPITKVSGFDVRIDFGKVKEQIEMIVALREIMG